MDTKIKKNRRIIKFRGKQKSWIYGGICVYKNGDVSIIDEVGQSFEVDPGTVGQFTPYMDNHRNNLWEGDIITTHCYNKDQIHVIELTRDGWQAGGYHLDAIYFTGSGNSFKKIGNIHDNPELLK